MSIFNFRPEGQGEQIAAVPAQLGTGEVYTSIDEGKIVKMGASDNYVPCAAGNEIEGFISVVEDRVVNGNKSFGTVVKNGRHIVELGADAATNAVARLDYVVADVQPAVGVAGRAKVKKGVPTTFKWRVISFVSGSGGAGSVVVIERP